MPQIPSNVSPGDLITASCLNGTFAVLADHEVRLQKLELALGKAEARSSRKWCPLVECAQATRSS